MNCHIMLSLLTWFVLRPGVVLLGMFGSSFAVKCDLRASNLFTESRELMWTPV